MRAWWAVPVMSVSFISTAAQADWQYTKWGMTRDEVIAASGGLAKPLNKQVNWPYGPPPGQTIEQLKESLPSLHAPFTSGARTFDAEFTFKSGKLSSVSLEGISGNDCYALRGDLEGRYGQPFATSRTNDFAEWQDRASNNRVMFIVTAAMNCSVTYTPLTSESTSNL